VTPLLDMRVPVAGERLHVVVEPGERVAVVGPAGSGKATVLRAAAGLVRGVAGSPERVAYVFQEGGLVSTSTILGNLTLPLLFAGSDAPDAEARARAALESTGLGGLAHELASGLTASVRQRVQLARALALGARLYVVEELLPESRGPGWSAWWDARGEEGVGVLFSTSHRRFAESLGARILMLGAAASLTQGSDANGDA
jgi:ABC-type polar amino acid transport system ATPase subunit